MSVIVTYDVSQRHQEVKDAMREEGFLDYWTSNDDTYYLPNTTLWKRALDAPQEAVNIFHRKIRTLNQNQSLDDVIEITHLLAFRYSTWAGITGEPHVED